MVPKIRTWDTELKKMYSWEDIIINKEKGDDYLLLGYKEGVITHFDHKQIPMMSTGLFDNSNPPKEIFEGDVVDFEDADDIENVYVNRGIIKWCQGGFLVKGANSATMDNLLDGEYLEVEVIGNIFENPELLEGRK